MTSHEEVSWPLTLRQEIPNIHIFNLMLIKVFFCLINSCLQIKNYNVLNYNNCSTDWPFPLMNTESKYLKHGYGFFFLYYTIP